MSDVVMIESADGTPLAARVSGSGPPMVLVHGTTSNKDTWAFVQPQLAEHYRVWAYDRRGRGDSGDATEHSLEREVADVLAVLAAAGERPHLVGHSFGAICALEAARTEPDLATLTIYEPPLHGERVADAARRAIEIIHAGQHEEAALLFLPEVAGFSEDEVAMLRSIPDVWKRIIETAADTFERETAVIDGLPWDGERYRSIRVPTLHVTGGLPRLSPAYLTHDEVAAALPHAEHAVIEGQRHAALVGDPDAFAAAVLRFTRSHG